MITAENAKKKWQETYVESHVKVGHSGHCFAWLDLGFCPQRFLFGRCNFIHKHPDSWSQPRRAVHRMQLKRMRSLWMGVEPTDVFDYISGSEDESNIRALVKKPRTDASIDEIPSSSSSSTSSAASSSSESGSAHATGSRTYQGPLREANANTAYCQPISRGDMGISVEGCPFASKTGRTFDDEDDDSDDDHEISTLIEDGDTDMSTSYESSSEISDDDDEDEDDGGNGNGTGSGQPGHPGHPGLAGEEPET